MTGNQVIPPPLIKATYYVSELAERWQVHPESIRRLIRDRKLKTLRGFRPYRVTYDEIRRYEMSDENTEIRERYLARRKGARR